MKRYLRLYKVLCVQYLKSIMQNKADFLMGLAGFFLTQLSGILFLYLVFEQIPSLQGWSLEQLIFIYGFAQIPRGIDHLFTDTIWRVAWWYVKTGEFDRYMLRPMNIFFQIVAERLQPDAVGELLMGAILVIRGLNRGIVIVDGLHLALFIVSVLAGSVIYTSIKLFFASIAFWVKVSGPFLQMAYEMTNFAKYPSEIYAKAIRFVITWVIPFAFVAYLPATYFLKATVSPVVILEEVIIAVILWILAYGLFNYGLSKYESCGN